MKKTRIYLVIFFYFLTISFFAQQREKAVEMLNTRGEIYIKFNTDTSISLRNLNRTLSIDKLKSKGKSNEITAYLNSKQFLEFQKENISYEVLTPPSLLLAVGMCADVTALKSWSCYPTYSQYYALMQEFQTNYPELCQLVEFGQSINGHKLLAVKISDNVSIKEDEPEFLYTSTMHGDEVTGYVLMLRLINYLLSNYGTDDRITELVNTTEIWINPLSNPDGTYYTSDNNINGAIRYNSNNIDLNRNFPDPIEGLHPDGNTWQTENIAMMDFMKAHNFVLSANLHGGAEVVNYPWDSWTSLQKKHPDDNWYQEISREYADTVHTNSIAGYMTYLNNGITNGGDWYVVSGGRQDYMNFYRHSREVTIEISNTKMPAESSLPAYWNYNYRSFLNYINRVHTGIYGKVTDQDGNPLHAKISMEGYDSDSSEIYADSQNGMYFRMLTPGNYRLVASLTNYSPADFDINITSDAATELNIVLQKYPEGIQIQPTDLSKIISYSNPVSNYMNLKLDLKQSGNLELIIYDITGKLIEKRNISVNKGINDIVLNTEKLKEGIYACKIRSKTLESELKFIKSNY